MPVYAENVYGIEGINTTTVSVSALPVTPIQLSVSAAADSGAPTADELKAVNPSLSVVSPFGG